MKDIDFVKMVASGNDFVIIDNQSNQLPVTNNQLAELVREICQRKKSIGADGVLLLEGSEVADIKMRVFNPDGSEVEMCGNGARCVALWAKSKINPEPQRVQGCPELCAVQDKNKKITIETKAGILEGEVKGDRVKIKLTDSKDYRPDIAIKINNRFLHINFINTGVPHVVLFVSGLDEIDINSIGRKIRCHKKFMPAGTNVDFVEILSDDSIKIRTYERGVEDETLACGTGAVAAAIITSYKLQVTNHKLKINVDTQGGETLRVYFDKKDKQISNVFLEGEARIVYEGQMKTSPLFSL